MGLNKKAQSGIFVSLIVAIMIFFAGVIVVDFIKDNVTDARTSSLCTAPATDGGKLLCLVEDVAVPYFILLILSIVSPV